MNSERLNKIVSLVDKNDTVLDVGCDHGYISILLKKNNLCKSVYASDISKNALQFAINNIKKNNLDIKCIVSDGFKNINEYFDTAIIAGMGASTIINILNYNNLPNKLILCSNNDYEKLRRYLNKINYKLEKEIVVKENNHYYIIMEYHIGKEKLNDKVFKYGINYDKEYLNYLIEKNNSFINNLPFLKKLKIKKENRIIKDLIEKK